MVQYKKQEIKELIDSTALRVFAEKGYQNTKITDISQSSGVSVGNIYKYYKGKEEIFYEVISEEFVSDFKDKITHKIADWKEEKKNSLGQPLINTQLLDFIAKNREIFLIIVGGSKGTKYENLKAELVNYLTETFIRSYMGDFRIDITENENIEMIKMIYKKHIEIIADILTNEEKEVALSRKLKFINEYHVYGITNFFQKS